MCWICDKRVMLHRLFAFISTLSFLTWHSTMAQSIPTYYLDDYCSRELDMTMANVKSGRLMLHRPGQNPIYPSCFIKIKAPVNKRLTFKFHSFDVDTPIGCISNFLRIYEDHQRQFPITDRLCNSENVPDKAYITNGEEAAVWLNKEHYLLDQVELIFTAFSFTPCVGGDYQCDNGHCISNEFYCNDRYDNCGDESDICLIKHGTVVGIIVAVVVMVLILAVLLALYMLRRQRKIRREKVAHILFVSPDQRSQLSFVSDRRSSTLKKQPSLLSHASSVRYPGIQTVAFMGTKAHSLGYTPFAVSPSPLGSQYSTLTRSGVALGGSNLGEKARSSIRSKPSKGSLGKGDTLPLPLSKTSMRKKPSESLRAPFYFDKDGYFSDSSASQTNSLDKHARRSSLDMTDAKKKKKKTKGKFIGKLKRKTKKDKDENIQSTKEEDHVDGKINQGFKNDKDIPGQEQMTEDLYIDGKQLINVANIPEIRITNTEDSYTPDQTVGNYAMPNKNYNKTSERNNSDGFSASTSIKSAEALNQLMERRKETENDHQQSEISPLRIPPRTFTANAVVHRPGDNAVQNATGNNVNDEIDIETVIESPSPSFDTVDGGRTQAAPTHISMLTFPSNDPGTTQRKRSMNSNANSFDEDIETIVENPPNSPDTGADNNTIPKVTHISALTLPRPTHNGGKNQSAPTSTRSHSKGEDEIDSHYYPQTNLQLADQTLNLSPTSRTSQGDSTSPLTIISSRPVSPTRQMGLNARHPDGSPFLLHKVNQTIVEEKLKQHPEDRADVRDHVISFRSYPSPVHTLERAGLFRNSSRRSARYSSSDLNESL